LVRASEDRALELGTGFEILIAVTMKSMVFWVVTPHSPERAQCFLVTRHFHLQCQRIMQSRNTAIKKPPEAGSTDLAVSKLHGVTTPKTLNGRAADGVIKE
jgi:hypothetical protein